MSFSRGPRHPIAEPLVSPLSVVHGNYAFSSGGTSPPSSGSGPATCLYYPLFFYEPYPVTCFWMINGGTVGTDNFDMGIYQLTDPSTGRLDLMRSIGNTLSAGSTNTPVTISTLRTAAVLLTQAGDSTDANSYTTASVTLKAGRLYLLAVENSKATTPDQPASTSGGTWTVEKTQAFNSAATPVNRITVLRCVPTADYTGTIVITFGGVTQTGIVYALTEHSGVDTTTNQGCVQNTSNTVDAALTVTATLAAFASASNATYYAVGKGHTNNTVPATGFLEAADSTAATPAQSLEVGIRVDNDTTADPSWGTNTGAGIIAIELKASTSPLVIPPGWCYLGYSTTGSTMTQFQRALSLPFQRYMGVVKSTATLGGLLSSVTPIAVTASSSIIYGGVANRSTV